MSYSLCEPLPLVGGGGGGGNQISTQFVNIQRDCEFVRKSYVKQIKQSEIVQKIRTTVKCLAISDAVFCLIAMQLVCL